MESQPITETPQAAPAKTAAKDISEYCPQCGVELSANHCKLLCPRCGYYMSCSDYITGLACGVGTSKTRASYLLLLLPFVYLQIFYGLGALGLVGPDEPRYAEVAKEMFQNGDYITPRLSGQPWLEKPILYYWIATLSFRLFGVNESAARLVSAWAAVLGILAVVLVGRDWIGF